MNFWDFIKNNRCAYIGILLAFFLNSFFAVVSFSKIHLKYIAIFGGFIVMVFSGVGLYYSKKKRKLPLKEKRQKYITTIDDEISVLEDVIVKKEEKREENTLRILKEKIEKRERLITLVIG